MANYVKSTNFTSKDTLPSGDALKKIKGTELDVEFNNIASAVASKADLVSPTFTGTPFAPTASPGTNTTQLATTAFVGTAITNYGSSLSIATAQIADSAVTAAKINDLAVTTAKINDGAVTTAKLASGAVPYATASVKGSVRVSVSGTTLNIFTTD